MKDASYPVRVSLQIHSSQTVMKLYVTFCRAPLLNRAGPAHLLQQMVELTREEVEGSERDTERERGRERGREKRGIGLKTDQPGDFTARLKTSDTKTILWLFYGP